MPDEAPETPPDPKWVSVACEDKRHGECDGMVAIIAYSKGIWMDVLHKCLCGCHDEVETDITTILPHP